MHLIGVIGFIVFGVLALSVAVWHELTWWRRRRGTNGQGTIVGFSESHDADGVSYSPEIEYQGVEGSVRFISNYGSVRKPHIGSSVHLIIDASGHSAEMISVSNRLIFTIVPILFGVIFILVGANIKPIEDAEQAGTGQPATRPESKSEGGDKPQPDAEGRSR
jgi:hypothetical protein